MNFRVTRASSVSAGFSALTASTGLISSPHLQQVLTATLDGTKEHELAVAMLQACARFISGANALGASPALRGPDRLDRYTLETKRGTSGRSLTPRVSSSSQTARGTFCLRPTWTGLCRNLICSGFRELVCFW